MNKIEDMARAIAAQNNCTQDCKTYTDGCGRAMSGARAAIKAMKDLPEDLLHVLAEPMDPCWGYSDEDIKYEWARKGWDSVFDSILSEEE